MKQGFPLHGRGVVEQLQDPSLSKELSRIVTSQGTVIRYMRDGSTEVNIPYTHVHIEGHAYQQIHDFLLENGDSNSKDTQIPCALQVLFADGSVSFSQDSGPVWVPDSEIEEENTSQETEDNKKG